jgi:hypothetical protein
MNPEYGTPNFFTKMSFPLSLRDYKKMQIAALNKQNCEIEIGKPEIEISIYQ